MINPAHLPLNAGSRLSPYIRKSTGLILISVFLVICQTAFADVCVKIDTERDNLPEADRSAARMVLLETLEKEGIEVDRTDQMCTETYILYNLKLGKTISVTLKGPNGERNARASMIDELPHTYSQMVKSLLSDQPMSTSSESLDRTNATSDQMSPRRAQADSIWYAKLGYGSAIGDELHLGPVFGVGWRYELDKIGIDASFFNLQIGVDSDKGELTGEGGINGSWAKLMVLYFFDPLANSSFYLAGGVSWGGTAIKESDRSYTGSGLQGEIGLGVELLRASSIRLFTAIDATLPFYYSYCSGNSKYTPTLSLVFGVGWGGSGIQVVRVVQ